METSTFILVLMMLVILCIDSDTEYFNSFANAQPTKCFDCEKGIPREQKYISGPTKCFSCEKELAKQYGSKYAALAQPSKCFSCEKQLLK